MEYRTADVFIRNIFAGKLQETEDGYEFAYDEKYLKSEKPTPVSLTLPLSEKNITRKHYSLFLMA